MIEITIKSLKPDNLIHKLNQIVSLFMNHLGNNRKKSFSKQLVFLVIWAI